MSIDEAAAVKAVQDGLEGRNVPIVHEEIRVVLAMALERDALRARVAELERVQDAAFRDAHRAEADAARLREALTQVRDAMLATGQGPDGDDDPRRPVATAVWRALASAPSAETWRQVGQHAAHPELDATPSAEPTPRAKAEAFFAGFAGDDDAGVLAWSEPSAAPTPRDMRVAEALEDFLNCPMVVSEGTSPVIVTIHVARERVEKWRAALASAPSAAVVAKAVGT